MSTSKGSQTPRKVMRLDTEILGLVLRLRKRSELHSTLVPTCGRAKYQESIFERSSSEPKRLTCPPELQYSLR